MTVAYIRVSSWQQVFSGPRHNCTKRSGLSRQKDTIREYATAHGLTVSKWFGDICSGDGIDRPGLQRLFAAIEAGSVGIVLIEAPDRLSRMGADETREIYDRAARCGADIVVTSDLEIRFRIDNERRIREFIDQYLHERYGSGANELRDYAILHGISEKDALGEAVRLLNAVAAEEVREAA